ncbi:MAG: polyprenyl synthetase family protein [Chloroflexaceae bacterium]|nr:polyprenyl synthetase family protein [Chloroflexaceae bacterium]
MILLALPPDLNDELAYADHFVQQRLGARPEVAKLSQRYLASVEDLKLRAALVLLAARPGTATIADLGHAAAAAELIHLAALVHQELVDEARRRRGTVTEQNQWEHGAALMLGDYFFALSAGEMALAPDSRVITYYSQAVMRICEGELAPVMSATPLEDALQQYFYKIGCKTAALFASAARAGMAIGGGSDAQIEHLGEYGYQLGLAFEVVNDILDYSGTPGLPDRPTGRDVQRGLITLPLIYAVHAGGGSDLAAVVDTHEPAQVAWAVQEVQRLGVPRAWAEARRLIETAQSHLEAFPASTARQQLHDVAASLLRWQA